MFTDIVDSTRKAEELGDRRWQGLLDRHHEIAKQTVTRHAGRFVRSTGDGILATFSGPGRAIVGATSLQNGIADILSTAWPSRVWLFAAKGRRL